MKKRYTLYIYMIFNIEALFCRASGDVPTNSTSLFNIGKVNINGVRPPASFSSEKVSASENLCVY
jgi:hypothetical protein